jgi:hypothetical protein
VPFVKSSLCERLWAASKESGRPVPRFSDDDVVDFMVVEAMSVKISAARKKEQEETARKQRLQSHRQLRGKKPGDPGLNLGGLG